MASRLRFTNARQLFDSFPTLGEDVAAQPSDASPLEFARGLLLSPTPEDAVTFCAYLLPRREAVWWACQCVGTLAAGSRSSKPLQAAESWVREPEEDRRRAALTIGMASKPDEAASWTALAAGWAGGSLAPEGADPIPPPQHLTAKAVRAAVLLALATVSAKERGRALAACIDACLSFAQGGDSRLVFERER
jgi:hypothetical protein